MTAVTATAMATRPLSAPAGRRRPESRAITNRCVWCRCCRDVQPTSRPSTASWMMASVAAPPMSPSWVARRQTSTSTVVRSAVPKTRITPNDVNVNRNTIAAAAAIDDRSSGSVTDRNVRHGPAPSVAAASSRSVGIRSHDAPTVRTTTARLNATCAPRIAHTLRSSESGRIATKAAPTTTVGNTNTAVSVLVSNRRPAEVEPSHRPGGSEADDDRQCRAGNGLPGGEPQHPPRVRSAERRIEANHRQTA